MQFANLMARVFNRPLLVTPQYLQVFFGAIHDRIDLNTVSTPDGSVMTNSDLKLLAENQTGRARKSYRIESGIARIPVTGTLVHKGGSLDAASGLTSYVGLENSLMEAAVDDDVMGIMLEIDSPGGEVSGLFDMVDQIVEARSLKPIWSVVDEEAASAAYAIAAATNRILIPRTGVVGSVGAVVAHTDNSKRLEDRGLNVTLIYSGDHKVDGNSFEPLAEGVQEDIQDELDEIRAMFAQHVAKGRSMSVDAVLDTEAAMYRGDAAVEVGFADEVMSVNEAFAAFIEHLGIDGAEDDGIEADAAREVFSISDLLASARENPEFDLAMFFDCVKPELIKNEINEIKGLAKTFGLDESALLDNISSPSDLVRLAVQSHKASLEQEIDSTVSPEGSGGKTQDFNVLDIYKARN